MITPCSQLIGAISHLSSLISPTAILTSYSNTLYYRTNVEISYSFGALHVSIPYIKSKNTHYIICRNILYQVQKHASYVYNSFLCDFLMGALRQKEGSI